MTYAVFTTGGQQFKAEPGRTVQVPLLAAEPGKTVTFDRVLLVSDGKKVQSGQPLVRGAKVTAEVARQGRQDPHLPVRAPRRLSTPRRSPAGFHRNQDSRCEGRVTHGA